jgi:hypothetical protein
MSQVIVSKEDGVSYYNYDNETCWTVSTSCQPVESRLLCDIIYHEKSNKPFAYLCSTDRRWYKVKDTIGLRNSPPIRHDPPSQPTIHTQRRCSYNITERDVEFNINIKFFYTSDTSEDFIEIPQGREAITHVCNVMKDEKLKYKLLYFTETVVQTPTPSACSLQGGKNKHKSYRRKRQQRRSKRRQSKRRQRK